MENWLYWLLLNKKHLVLIWSCSFVVSKGLNGLNPILVSIFLLGTHDFKGFQGLIRQLKNFLARPARFYELGPEQQKANRKQAESRQKTNRTPGSVVHSDPRQVHSSGNRRDFGALAKRDALGRWWQQQDDDAWWRDRVMEDEKVRVSTRRNPSFWWDSTEHVEETNYGKSMGSVCLFFQETIPRKLGHPGKGMLRVHPVYGWCFTFSVNI